MNKLLAILLLVGMFILQLNLVAGYGITPGKIELTINPGETKEFSFKILDVSGKTMRFQKTGELPEYITIPQEKVYINSSPFEIKLKMSLPENVGIAGTREAQILIEEIDNGDIIGIRASTAILL